MRNQPASQTVEVDSAVDALIGAYVRWREASSAVTDAYERWRAARACDRSAAFQSYCTALDDEESAAEEYRLRIQRVSRAC